MGQRCPHTHIHMHPPSLLTNSVPSTLQTHSVLGAENIQRSLSTVAEM